MKKKDAKSFLDFFISCKWCYFLNVNTKDYVQMLKIKNNSYDEISRKNNMPTN